MEGKKSFVLYADQREVFDELSNEDAGRLIKHIFSYVNDENPEASDQLLKIAFLPIKTQLKRDLKVWDAKKQQRSEAGRKGGLAKASNASEVLAKPSNATNDVANLAVNVNGNVNVNDNNNNKAKAFFVADANLNEKEYRLYFYNIIKEKQSSRDVLFMQNKIDLSLRNDLWSDFINNAIMETPQIENDNHAWNCFKRFVKENAKKYEVKKQSDFIGYD
jgi:hypothetical protein